MFINTTDLLINEGKMLEKTKKITIPLGYFYMGEHMYCPSCQEEAVYGETEINEEGGYTGNFICAACGYEWSKL